MLQSNQLFLRDLAQNAGFSSQSLAKLIGVHHTTVMRHWLRRDWMNTMKSSSVHKIVSMVPGAAEELQSSVLTSRGRSVVTRCTKAGLRVHEESLEAVVAGGAVARQYLLTALEASACLVDQDLGRAEACLHSLWGREQTRALDVVFGHSAAGSILDDNTVLLEASTSALETWRKKRGNPFSRTLSLTHLAHHLGKAGGGLIDDDFRSKGAPKDSLFLRGSYMGVLRRTDDLDVAERYHELVQRDGVALMIEAWAFPTWTGDLRATNSFDVPASLGIGNTAREVLDEVESYNDGYVYYLLRTYVPVALTRMDPLFGGHLAGLEQAVLDRREKTSSQELRTLCSSTIELLKESK